MKRTQEDDRIIAAGAGNKPPKITVRLAETQDDHQRAGAAYERAAVLREIDAILDAAASGADSAVTCLHRLRCLRERIANGERVK